MILIFIFDGYPIFFIQNRVGKNFSNFNLIKFRTMKNKKYKSKLTNYKDSRVTRFGYFLRKTKIDEIPQLLNVFIGDMSLVGPRPELNNYLNLYEKKKLKKIISIKPGITDFASIYFSSEELYFKNSNNIIYTYKNKILPIKQKLCLKYLREISFLTDFKILFLTLVKIFKI